MRQQEEKSIQGDDAVYLEEDTGHGRDMSGLESNYLLLAAHLDAANEPLLDSGVNDELADPCAWFEYHGLL